DGIRYKLVTGVQTCALPISLTRYEHVLAVVVLPGHVVVMATYNFHIGFERGNLSRRLYRRDHVLHHQLAICQRVVLRPVHCADRSEERRVGKEWICVVASYE